MLYNKTAGRSVCMKCVITVEYSQQCVTGPVDHKIPYSFPSTFINTYFLSTLQSTVLMCKAFILNSVSPFMEICSKVLTRWLLHTSKASSYWKGILNFSYLDFSSCCWRHCMATLYTHAWHACTHTHHFKSMLL